MRVVQHSVFMVFLVFRAASLRGGFLGVKVYFRLRKQRLRMWVPSTHLNIEQPTQTPSSQALICSTLDITSTKT